jgi:hypothetical protein
MSILFAMLDPDRRHLRYKTSSHHKRLYQPISTAPVGNVPDKMSPDLIALCEAQGAEAMATFRYSTKRLE